MKTPIHLWIVGVLSLAGLIFTLVIPVILVLLLIYARRMVAKGVLG